MLLTLLVACAMAAAVGLGLLLLVVLPFVRTVDAAERRGGSTFRWGGVALGVTLLGLLVGFWDLSGGHSLLLLLPAAALPWLGLAGVLLLADVPRLAGSLPAHQR